MASQGPSLETTSRRLLLRARDGDRSALGQLFSRYLPALNRWAHGRLPRWARTMAGTSDLIQDALAGTIGRLHAIEPRGRRVLGAYLLQAVRNRMRDEHRRVARRGIPAAEADAVPDSRPSPLEQAMTDERMERYRDALASLDTSDRELIVAHIELEYTHEQLGCMTGRSPNAARMALQRAIGRLAARIRQD